jgi:hypothetical protein
MVSVTLQSSLWLPCINFVASFSNFIDAKGVCWLLKSYIDENYDQVVIIMLKQPLSLELVFEVELDLSQNGIGAYHWYITRPPTLILVIASFSTFIVLGVAEYVEILHKLEIRLVQFLLFEMSFEVELALAPNGIRVYLRSVIDSLSHVYYLCSHLFVIRLFSVCLILGVKGY